MGIEKIKIMSDKVDSSDTMGEKSLDRDNAKSLDAERMKDFFVSNKKLFEHFSGGAVEMLPGSEAPVSVPTAGIDLENGKMYFGEEFFAQIESADKKAFTVLHEGGHLKKLLELLRSENGGRSAKKWMKETREKRRYGMLDNCVADAGINADVVDYAPTLKVAEQNLYNEDLFKVEDGEIALDMKKDPKHIQFAQTILYESRVEGGQALVDPIVRAEIDKLKNYKSKGVSLLDYITSAGIPENMRIALQKKYLEPVLDKLFEEDVKDEEEKKNKGEGQDSEGSEKSNDEKGKSGDENEGESDGNREEKEGGGADEEGGEESKDGEDNGDGEKTQNGDSGEDDGGSEKDDKANPEDQFGEYYDKFGKSGAHIISPEEIEKEIEKYIKNKGKEKTSEEMGDEAYAKIHGVSVENLETYRRFYEEISRIKNPETNESVIEELRSMFKKIINERKKDKYVPKYPVKEGELLAYPAEAVIAVKGGDHEPEVWETVEKNKRPAEMYGDFDVTIVADRSGSMDGEKAIEQRKAVALLLEALKDFSDDLSEARMDLENDLHVSTEVWGFGSESEVNVIKPMSETLSEKERTHTYETLGTTPGGSTYDFLALERIEKAISEEEIKNLKEKKTKKIIIALSDGGSSDEGRLKNTLLKLRDKKVVVVGVGITNDGVAVESAYAPDGQVCEDVGKLASVLSDILKEHLQDL